MATELVLIRHGHAVRINGDYVNSPLTELGKRQALLTGQHIVTHPEQIDGFYSSPLKRTRETATIIGGKIGRQPVIQNGIQELEGTEVPQLVLFESLARLGIFGNYLYRNCGRPLTWPIIGRVSQVLSELIDKFPNERLVVVTHSGVISSVLAWYYPKRRRRWWRYTVDNCSFTRLRVDGSNAELLVVNDTNHLAPEITTQQPPAQSVEVAEKIERAVPGPATPPAAHQ